MNMALNDDFIDPHNYILTLINEVSTLAKYKVAEFEISTDETRCYNISSIFRAWVDDFDNVPGGDNTVSEVSYEVGKQYNFTADGVACLDVETITITEKYVGELMLKNGIFNHVDYCKSHYVAFSTDKPIGKLMEAELVYTSTLCQGADNSLVGGDFSVKWVHELEGPKEKPLIVKADQKATNGPTSLLGHTYEWKRIRTAENFSSEYGLNDEVKEELKTKQWVLQFVETDWIIQNTLVTFTKIEDVSILRLKFETLGKTYNLGVVDNKQTGSHKPDNPSDSSFWKWLKDFFDSLSDAVKTVIYLVFGAIGIAICLGVVKLLISFIGLFKKGGKR